jgi:RNA-directed DNA polymerase
VTTSMTLMAPTGGDGAAAGATRALNQDEVTNVTPDLLDAVLARDNLWRAWKRVKANRGAPGIDGVRLEDFPADARNHWLDVREQIEQGRYAPQPVRRVAIPKPDGGERLLGIPTILDLAKLFDTVDHDRLINRLGQTIRDQRLLALIGSYLRAGVLV